MRNALDPSVCQRALNFEITCRYGGNSNLFSPLATHPFYVPRKPPLCRSLKSLTRCVHLPPIVEREREKGWFFFVFLFRSRPALFPSQWLILFRRQIVAWLFGQTDVPIKVTSAIIDRLSRNFRLDTRVGQLDAEQSRTPVLQFISKCDRLAQQLHQVVLRVVRIEGEDTPYNLPEKATGKSSSQKEKLELVLQHIVNTLDYIFNYMEDDLALLYLFCDMVVPAETKKSPPEAAAKRVFFVVERSKRIKLNLERLQMFVLIKHNGPDPTLVEDLLGLCQLSERGFISADEFEFRQGEAIENIVRAFVTQGRVRDSFSVVYCCLNPYIFISLYLTISFI